MRKQCSICGRIKNAGSFRKRSDHPHLLRSECIECSKKIQKNKFKNLPLEKKIERRKKRAEEVRRYRRNHPEMIERNYGQGPNRFGQSRWAAKRGGCKWELSRKEYYELIKKPCEYCGDKLAKGGIALDKVNNKIKIYRMDNVVPCCPRCNWVKGDWFNYEQMIEIGKTIARIMGIKRRL